MVEISSTQTEIPLTINSLVEVMTSAGISSSTRVTLKDNTGEDYGVHDEGDEKEEDPL